MATQSDLEKLRKQLSDLDAKLKSMRGNSAQRNPRFDSAMANQNFKNSMAEQRARMAVQQGQFTQDRLMGAPSIQGSPFSRDEDYYNSRYELQELNDLARKSSGKNKAQIIPTAEIPPRGAIKRNVGSKSINPDYNPEVARKWQEKVRKNLYEQAAKYVPKNDLMALQSKYNDYTSQVPQYVGEGNEPEMTPEQYAEGNKFMEANIARIIAQNPNAKEFLPKPIGSIQGMSKAQQEAIRQFQYNQFITKSREGLQTQNQYTQGRLMGAPTNQSAQSRVPMGFSTYEEAGIPPEQAKILDDEMAKMQSEIAAKQGRQNAEDIYNQFNEVASGINELMPAQPQQAPQPIQTIAGPRSAVQMDPQKMQAFQNFLQQGIQRSNTMNQDAASNFANLQAGAPTTQPTIPLPQLRGVTAQPRNLPRPRQPKGFGGPIGRSAF